MKIARLNEGPEIFHSVQGEGRTTGRSSIFVRTSMCNLHCTWCDTDYTWNWEGTDFKHENDAEPGYVKFKRAEQIIELPVEEIADRIAAINCQNVVITGGEPLIHQEDVEQLIDLLRDKDANYRFEIETNATLLPSEKLHDSIDQFNVSPKLSNSGDEKRYREIPEVLTYFASHPEAWFKFVIKTEDDLAEVLALRDLYEIPAERIYLMPEGRTAQALSERRSWVVEQCKKHGFQFSDRLHIHLWGSKRGV